MAYNEQLAGRVRLLLEEMAGAEEKGMFGGLAFMIDDKMCAGVVKNDLMLRIDPGIYEACLQREGCRAMNFTGRPMKGFVFVDDESLRSDNVLKEWIDLALAFNTLAEPSKKKKPKTVNH
jgi:TfoX/Sxy family transcriptional regulator of competence genes